MNVTEESTQSPWEYDTLIVTVQQSHPCSRCRYWVRKDTQAVRVPGFFPSYYHYPKCPRSAKENKPVKP